jgi:hypothetical protein
MAAMKQIPKDVGETIDYYTSMLNIPAYGLRVLRWLHYLAWEHLRPPLQMASYADGILGAVDVRSSLANPKLLKPSRTFLPELDD